MFNYVTKCLLFHTSFCSLSHVAIQQSGMIQQELERWTHRFCNPGHCRDCQTKEVFTLQIAGEQLEHFRFFPHRSNGLQDFIPHTYTTIGRELQWTKKKKKLLQLVLKQMPEDMRTRTQHWESFCLWLPKQIGQDLKSGEWFVEFLIFWDLTNPKQTRCWFCTLSSQKLSFQCSQHGNFQPSDKNMDRFLLGNSAEVWFSENTQYILFPLMVCRQCSLCEGINTHSTEALRPRGL